MIKKVLTSAKRALVILAVSAIVGSAMWNILEFDRRVLDGVPPRNADELVMQESRFADLRIALLSAGYRSGPVDYLTPRDLTSAAPTPEDNIRWAQAQYVMLPWILLHQRHGVSGTTMTDAVPLYAIVDFWGGSAPIVPGNFEQVYDSGRGLILFRTSKVRP
jgi:hypothetical protein